MSARSRTIPDGPLWCPQLGRSFPLSLTVPQAALAVGQSERTMYRAWQAGTLLGVKLTGGDIRIATTQLLEMHGLKVEPREVSA